MTDPAVPLVFRPGLGYSPGSGPPQGGWVFPPVSNFFGDNLSGLLPSGRFFGRRRFGYPLDNQANPNLNMSTFPLPPIGSGNTPGGSGGVWLQGMPNFNSYWGYGRRRSARRRKPRKKRSRRRKSRTKRSRG